MDNKVIIALIVALIAIIAVGFAVLHVVPNGNVSDSNVSNVTENTSVNVSEAPADTQLNVSAANVTAANNTVNITAGDVNNTNATSNATDPGDILHKQTFTITGNETGPKGEMEPGTYVMYYTDNDGVIKIEKI